MKTKQAQHLEPQRSSHLEPQGSSHLEPQQQAALSILEQPGQALDAQTRAILEPRFGHNFADVRVHHDVGAATALDSKAFAFGQDIVLGNVDTGTPPGLEILTHELAHTVQQRGLAPRASNHTPNDARLESDARAATRSVFNGESPSVARAEALRVSTWDDSETNLAISLGLTAGGMLLPGLGSVAASAAGGADAVRQGPAANDPMADMKNVEMGLGFGNAVVGAGSAAVDGVSSAASGAYNWLDRGVRGIYGM